LELLEVPGGTVQYHPEAGPGPHDSLYLFDRFISRIDAKHGGRPAAGASAGESAPDARG
jgi:carbamoyl-phosphate synthase small subunit